MTDKKEDIEAFYVCCLVCKRYTIKILDKTHYIPLQLFRVITKDGKFAMACQEHVGQFDTYRKMNKAEKKKLKRDKWKLSNATRPT